ncbi:MAG: hypothetical protein ACTSO2_19435, partial [Promethearchaeota archaeon]
MNLEWNEKVKNVLEKSIDDHYIAEIEEKIQSEQQKIHFFKIPLTYLDTWKEEIKLLEKYKDINNIIVCGTGANAIYLEALKPKFPMDKNIWILDAPDPYILKEVNTLDKKDTICIFISRSGNTLEIISLYSILKEFPNKIVIASKGFLKELAEKNKDQIFSIRTDIAGRFMLSTQVVGLPIYLINLDYNKIICGLQSFLKNSVKLCQSPSWKMATGL